MKKNLVKLSVFIFMLMAVWCLGKSDCYATEGTWQHDATGWWWKNPDGSFPSNKWETIHGNWYYFGENGYAVTGWYAEDGEWFYFDPTDCYAYTGWHDIGGHTYYFYPNACYAAKGWQNINGTWYYFRLTGSDVGIYVNNPNYNGTNYEAGTLKGIDVSVHQGNMDWNAVRSEGISYAMVRVGNNRNLDSNFSKNMRAANAAGIYTGVYFYSKATTEAQSLGDAQWVINHIKGYNVNYPVAIDVEDATQAQLGSDSITRIIKVFCDEIRAAGYTPMVYCNENWARNHINLNALPGVERWIARYNYYYDSSISRNIWQSSSSTRITGISSRYVDLNFARTSYVGIGNRTSPAAGYSPSTGVWMNNAKGYWYAYTNGGYPTDKWERIGGVWYYFNHAGYMVKGWQLINGTWYFFEDSGAMHIGWINSRGVWYYLNSSGAMATGWIQVGGNWFYLDGNGAMRTGWLLDCGTWYYLNANGAMATGWVYVGGNWFYMNGSGAMHKGWLLYGNSWYYLLDSGAMARNTWIGPYWINANGVWAN